MIEQGKTERNAPDAAAELAAALAACALADRSDLRRLVGTGKDLVDLLQRLGTGDLRGLAPGKGALTVLTTAKGRIVERLFVTHLGPTGVLVVGGAGEAAPVLDHLKRYTFAEQTGLSDRAGDTGLLTLSGPRAAEALAEAGLPCPEALGGAAGGIAGAELHVVGHDGLSGDGFAVLCGRDDVDAVRDALKPAVEAVGGAAVGAEAVEARRVLLGLPAGAELTGDYNPLEAGLWTAVSFDKGCYMGQEVVARLRTYDKVSRHLWGLALPAGGAAVAAGTELFAGGRPVGRITSCLVPPGHRHAVALGYVKHKHVEDDTALAVGSADSGMAARRVELPMTGKDAAR